MSKMKLALDVVRDLRSLADSIETLANATAGSNAPDTPTPTQTATQQHPTTPTEKPLTLVELRAFVAERSTPENRPKIKALLGKYGVAKLTELPEEYYTALKREVEML